MAWVCTWKAFDDMQLEGAEDDALVLEETIRKDTSPRIVVSVMWLMGIFDVMR